MEINFGSNIVNTTIAFDRTENANYNFTNNNFWIHGNNFNGKVYFPYGANNTSVRSSYILNKKVVIPNSVRSLGQSFENCYNFNQPVNIPDGVKAVQYMFENCYNFNQPVNIPNNVSYMQHMFGNCYNFNQPVNIPNSVSFIHNMFYNCTYFNQPINIPNSVTDAAHMFDGCQTLNQPINIPNSVTNATYMFNGCHRISNISMRGNIYTSLPSTVFMSMFRSSTSLSLNIHLNQVEWNPNTFANFLNSSCIGGGIKPNWDVIDNGYRNALYNIYIYTNAVFAD